MFQPKQLIQPLDDDLPLRNFRRNRRRQVRLSRRLRGNLGCKVKNWKFGKAWSTGLVACFLGLVTNNVPG